MGLTGIKGLSKTGNQFGDENDDQDLIDGLRSNSLDKVTNSLTG